MYRILVTSDSHGDYEYICDAIDNIIDIDLIVHLGDHAADIREVMKKYPDYEFRS
ncbi:MAG: metallophosphoesterase, partial [Clostridia bacterium]|nr:metallophosphoesterase [Clostridia bacterium]